MLHPSMILIGKNHKLDVSSSTCQKTVKEPTFKKFKSLNTFCSITCNTWTYFKKIKDNQSKVVVYCDK